MKVLALAREVRVRRNTNRDENVSGFASARACRFALSSQPQRFSIFDAGRNLHADCFLLAIGALHNDLRLATRNGSRKGHG